MPRYLTFGLIWLERSRKMRYVIVKNDAILQILHKEPLFVPNDTVVFTYEGSEPDNWLSFVNGKIVATHQDEPSPIPVSVEKYQKEMLKYVEDQIDNLRSQFASSVASQNEVYWEKTQEAIDYAAAGFPSSVENYPFIAVDVDITGQTGEQVALNILAKRRQWLNVAAKTEKIRKIARKQITTCRTNQEVDEVVNNTLLHLNSIS